MHLYMFFLSLVPWNYSTIYSLQSFKSMSWKHQWDSIHPYVCRTYISDNKSLRLFVSCYRHCCMSQSLSYDSIWSLPVPSTRAGGRGWLGPCNFFFSWLRPCFRRKLCFSPDRNSSLCKKEVVRVKWLSIGHVFFLQRLCYQSWCCHDFNVIEPWWWSNWLCGDGFLVD